MGVIRTQWMSLLAGSARLWTVDDDPEQLDDAEFLAYLLGSVGLVLLAGLMSGLTLGLMSLDEVDLEVLRRSGTSKQKACARRILPVMHNPHRLLVTLLVCNAIAAEALPLVLDRLTDPITAVIISVTVVLLFGEIIPQAACSAYGLEIGASSAGFVRALMFLTAPLNVPIGWILDRVLGQRETALFRRGELKALVDIHGEGQAFGGSLSADEVKIIKGALDLTHKTAKAAMTPLDLVFMLSLDAVLDEETLTAILASGHSRIPVHRPGNRSDILGIVLVKELILVNPGAGVRLSGMKVRSLPHILADTPMYDMLKLFELGRSHMAVLTRPTREAVATRRREANEVAIDVYSIEDGFSEEDDEEEDNDERLGNGRRNGGNRGSSSGLSSSGSGDGSKASERPSVDVFALDYAPHEVVAVGIITIEDVLEELLGSEIVDETDQFVDNMHSTRVNAASMARSLPPHLRKALAAWQVTPRVGTGGAIHSLRVPPKRTSIDDAGGEDGGLFSRLPRAMHPSNPRPRSVAAQLGTVSRLGWSSRSVYQGRRTSNMSQMVQEQLDMLQPLLDASAGRYTTPEGPLDEDNDAPLRRENSI